MPSFRCPAAVFVASFVQTQGYKGWPMYHSEVEEMASKFDTDRYLETFCICNYDYPHCDDQNRRCYKDNSRTSATTDVCAGRCMASYNTNNDRNGVPMENITRALREVGVTRREADACVNETKAYKTWLQTDASTGDYMDHQAETIKRFAFRRIDESRGRLAEKLSSQVDAVSALSARLAGEPGGGSPDEQADLTRLLAGVEKDRDGLQQFGLKQKISEMHVVKRLMEKAEKSRMKDIRRNCLRTRLAWLRAERKAKHLMGRWDYSREEQYENRFSDDEQIFDRMEQDSERYMDDAHDEIQDIYEHVGTYVQHRIKLLKEAAEKDAKSGDDDSFLFN